MGVRLDFSSSFHGANVQPTEKKDARKTNEEQTERERKEQERPRITENQSFNEKKRRVGKLAVMMTQ